VPAFDLALRSSWAYQAFRPDFPNEIKSHPNRQKLENSSKKIPINGTACAQSRQSISSIDRVG
jgi:hypothetical protein